MSRDNSQKTIPCLKGDRVFVIPAQAQAPYRPPGFATLTIDFAYPLQGRERWVIEPRLIFPESE